MALAVVNALWIGPHLGPVHVACLTSALRLGHRVILHVYEPPIDAPAGVEFFDAGKLMPAEQIVRHRKHGSLALASDIYRYRILRAGMGLYLDCDVFCVRPIEDAEYIFGWADHRFIASAVLKFPCDSPLLDDLCQAADDPHFVPPWAANPKRWYLQARRRLGMPLPVSRQRWGTIGPRAVTWFSTERGLAGKARPPEVFSPVAYQDHERLFDPSLTLDDLIGPSTLAVHLFHERMRRRPAAPPPSSPLGRMIAQS